MEELETEEAGSASDGQAMPTFNASYIRYDRDEEVKEEVKKASSKVAKLPKVLVILGVEELLMPSMWKACLVECFGMAVFTFAHVAIVSASTTFTYPPLLISIFHGLYQPPRMTLF